MFAPTQTNVKGWNASIPNRALCLVLRLGSLAFPKTGWPTALRPAWYLAESYGQHLPRVELGTGWPWLLRKHKLGP